MRNLFRILYSPLKAFKEIASAPDVKAPLIILLVTLLASLGTHYVSASKTLLEDSSGSGTYIPLTATDLFRNNLVITLTDTVFRFFFQWLIYGGAFLLALKLLKAKEGPWHHLFIIIGYTLIIAAIFIFVEAILFSTLPIIDLEFEVWNGALEGNEEMIERMILAYEEKWSSALVYQLGPYFSIITTTWIAALCAVAVHFLREVSWNKAIVVSAIVSVISMILLGPLAF